MKKALFSIAILLPVLGITHSAFALTSCAPGDTFDVNTGKACLVMTIPSIDKDTLIASLQSEVASLTLQVNSLTAQLPKVSTSTITVSTSSPDNYLNDLDNLNNLTNLDKTTYLAKSQQISNEINSATTNGQIQILQDEMLKLNYLYGIK